MRNFEERKAEIFRRSHERIALRKRRQKQLLGIGAPLVCAAVCLAVLLPGKADTAAVDNEYSLQLDGMMDDAPAEGCGLEEACADETPAAAERKEEQVDAAGTLISNSHGYANMSLVIPDGWEYEITEDSPETGNFGIVFRPEGQQVGSLSLMYFDGWGFCGTGLKTKTDYIGGQEVSIGTYDGRKNWNYIRLKYLPGDYVFLNTGADGWYDQYEEEINGILASAVVAEGIRSRAEAEEIALSWANELDVGVYEVARTGFTMDNGVWEILLGAINNTGPDHTIHIFPDGIVKEVVLPQE